MSLLVSEKNSQKDYHDLRSKIPRENLPYGCERNAENNNSIVFPDYFRFALNSSVNTGKLFTLPEIFLYTLDQLLVSKMNGTSIQFKCCKNDNIHAFLF